jgi:hypothetical protein
VRSAFLGIDAHDIPTSDKAAVEALAAGLVG